MGNETWKEWCTFFHAPEVSILHNLEGKVELLRLYRAIYKAESWEVSKSEIWTQSDDTTFKVDS